MSVSKNEKNLLSKFDKNNLASSSLTTFVRIKLLPVAMSNQKSSKNILQEYCVAKGSPHPVYDTYRESGPSHNPVFKSKVILDNSLTFVATGSSKKAAELKVAKVANIYFGLEAETPPRDNECTCSPKSDTAILIDLENMSGDVPQFQKLKGVDIYGFATTNHPSSCKEISPIKLKTVNSTVKDAADMYLAMALTQMIASREYENYVIATSDHFAEAVVDVCKSTSDFIEYSPNIRIVKCYGEY